MIYKALEPELRNGPLAEKAVVLLGPPLERGLQATHEQGVVHRHLKRWIGLAPGGSPLVLRAPRSSDIYVLDWEAP